MPGGKGGAKRIPPFDQATEEQTIGPLRDLISGSQGLGGINLGAIQNQIGARDPLQLQAGKTLSGPVGSESFLQGGQGALGTAGGLFGQAQQAATRSSTDILNDPNTQALLAAQRGGAQTFLNQNLGDIGASAQRASGGVGSGSGETAAKTRAVTQAGSALTAQQAQTIQGLQQQELQRSGVLGQLGGGLGQLGLGQAGLGSQLLGQQIGLGGQFQGMDTAAAAFPLDLVFKLGELLKSSSGVRQPSILEQIGSIAGGVGSAASGGAAVAKL